jgi:hypothetical protein
MIRTRVLPWLAVAAVAALTPATASAQTTDNDQITATGVVTRGIDVAAAANLDFGTLLPGFAGTVLFTDVGSPGAGQFLVSGATNAEVSLTFTSLPNVLTRVGFTETMPIVYTAGYSAAGNPATATDFTAQLPGPPAAPLPRLDATTGELTVYLGGTVTPAPTQAAGTYEATVVLEAAYTGN